MAMQNDSRTISRLLVLALVIAGVLFAAAPGWAQESRGAILGKVTDATGAVVPAASVVVENKAMGTKVALQTNEAGLYQASYLIPGIYQITVEVPGFKKFVRDGIQVQVNDRLEVNISVEVGPAAESITVTGETPLLNTTSASMGQVVDTKRITELPLSYGDPFVLIGIAGGVAFARDPRLDRPFEPTHIVGYTMDGTRANRSDITLDGAVATARANANEVTASYVPPTDIIQEFKVQTATFDAGFGQTEGGVTNISIKAGTNTFHGSAYYNATRPSWWGTDFYGNAAGQGAQKFIFNRWGGSLGGPVNLPKLYNGKNRTFFLWGYEGIHDSRPRNDGTSSIPTAKMKTGDFSDLLAVGSNYQIYNPWTRRAVAGGRYQEDPFPNNIIPSALINPVAAKILTYFPDPTSAGSANPNFTNNFQQTGLTENAKYYSHTWRGDHNVSDKQRIFVRASVYRRDSTYNDYFHNNSTGTWFQFLSRSAVFDDVYTLTPTTVLNVKYGYNRFIRVTKGNPAAKGMDLTTLGFPSYYNGLIPDQVRGFPRIDVTGYQGTAIGGEWRPNDVHSLVANLQKSHGSHLLRGGMEFRAYRQNQFFFGNDMTGRFIFDSSWTRGPLDNATTSPGSIGQSVAALLLGLPSNSSSVARNASLNEQSTAWGFFFQDDWRVNNKLTLNLGLRWEFEQPMTERFNRSVKSFDFSYVQPFQAAAQAAYAKNQTPEVPVSAFTTTGGLVFSGINGQSRGLYETPKKNLMPRFGFAYKLDNKTVLRGGYGIFYGFLGQRRGDVIQSGFSRSTPFIVNSDGVHFDYTLSKPFPNGILEPVGASLGPATFVGQGVSFFNQHPLMPQMQRWQLGLQHEFRNGFFVEASYVGNKGIHIEIGQNLNATPQKYLSKSPVRDQATIDSLSRNMPNPFLGLLPADASSSLTGTNIARSRLLVPYPSFDAVNSTRYDGYSWYHSLQARIEKRFAKTYTIAASYTFAKFMQATETLQTDDPKPYRTISDTDFPHRLSLSGIVELPFGTGRRFLPNVPVVSNILLGGWQISAVASYQSGAPLGWGNILFYGDVKNIPLPGDQRTPNRWFNTDAGFEKDTTKQLGSNIRTFPLRFGSIRADAAKNCDAAVIKNTRVREGKDIQFRAELMNVFNHPFLRAPSTSPTAGAGVFGSTFTTSTQANYPRRIQLGLRYVF